MCPVGARGPYLDPWNDVLNWEIRMIDPLIGVPIEVVDWLPHRYTTWNIWGSIRPCRFVELTEDEMAGVDRHVVHAYRIGEVYYVSEEMLYNLRKLKGNMLLHGEIFVSGSEVVDNSRVKTLPPVKEHSVQ